MSTQKPIINDDERFNVQLGLAAAQQPLGTDCPGAGEMAAYVDHTLSGPRKTVMESHLAHCTDCYSHWRDMVELLTPEAPPVVASTWSRSVMNWWQKMMQWPVLGGGFATAMVAIFAVIILLPTANMDEQLADLYAQWPDTNPAIDDIFVSQPMKSIGHLTSQDLAYKQGLREGLQRLVPSESAFWQEVITILTDLSGDCINAPDPQGCQAGLLLSRQVGQWVAINYLQCFANRPELDVQSPYWAEQQSLAQQLFTSVGQQTMDNQFQSWLAQIASHPQINKAEFCTRIEQLTALALP